MFCPNYKNKEVFDGFNEIVEALGGAPLTEEEFRDSTLRNLRTGSDYSAMEAAYKIYHLNNGNLIDLAPNGNSSLLFLSLLKEFNGDRAKAIRAKSRIYSQAFRNKFGDWTLIDNKSIFNTLDANGEPSIEALKSFLDERGIKFLTHNLVVGENGIKSMSGAVRKLIDLRHAKEEWENVKDLPKSERREKMLAIKFAYGWELGVDGKWRHEIPPIQFKDSKFKLNALLELKKRDTRPITKKLGDVVDLSMLPLSYARKLLSAELTLFFSNSSRLGGYREHNGKHSFLLNLLNDSPKSTITHEIQHYIQQEEGFLGGGNSDSITDDDYLKQTGRYDEYFDIFNSKKGNYFNLLQKILSTDEEYLKYKDSKEKAETEAKRKYYESKMLIRKVELENLYEEQLYEEEQKDIELLDKLLDLSPKERYFRIAGEVEARAVGHRDTNLSENDRKTSLVTDTMFKDVAEEDLLFLQDAQSNVSAITKADLSQTFGTDIYNRLLSGEQVSTRDLLEVGMTDAEVFHGNLSGVAKILQKHNVPVMIAEGLTEGTVATTMTDEDGNSVIMINPDWINTVSKQRQGEILIHEIIHAVTANALNAPKTAIEATFKKRAYKVFNLLKNAVRNEDWHLFDVYGGLYAFCDIHEFVSEFISNPNARSNIYALAKEIDENNKGKAITLLKNFVNALFRLFVNKNIFKTTTEQLQQYEKYLQDYLNGHNPITNTKRYTKQQLKDMYHSIDDSILNNDKISVQKDKIHKGMIAILKHNVKLGWAIDDIDKNDVPIKGKYTWIKNSLQSRINAIQTSRLPQDAKTILISETKGWLDLMNNPQVSTYEAFSQFLNALGPRIIDSIDELDHMRLSDHVDPAIYMYQMHDNIGGFDTILRDISSILKNEVEILDIVAQFNEQNQETPITASNISELQTAVEELSGLLSTAKGILSNLLNRVAVGSLSRTIKSAGSIEGMEMIQNMISRNPVIEQDVSWFLVLFGQADASPNEIVRAVAHIIQKTNDKVDDMTLDKAIELIDLASKLKSGESVLDLYETVDGKRTGFIVREFNHGKYLRDRDEFMKKLNEKFGLPAKNNVPPSDEEDAIKWEMARQEFLSKHAEQRYIPKYYEAWASVPRHVKEQIGKLNGAMMAILQKYNAIDKDGTRHYEKITNDDDWNQFLSLKMSKKLMRETHDRFGNEKEGSDLNDAIALLNVYKQLYGTTYTRMKTKKDEWSKARNEVIKQCGGQELLDKYLKGEPNSFDFKTFDKWESRNTKYDFKRLANGKPVVFDDFEQEMQGASIDYGEEYRQLLERERSLLRPIYDPAGEPNPNLLPDSVKNIINNEIHPRMKQIRELVIKSTPGYSRLADAKKKLFDAYFKFVDTRYYRDIQSAVFDELDEEGFAFDEDMFELALSDYGRTYEYEDGMFMTVPYKWYQTLRAKDDNYMEPIPNEAWTEPGDERNYDNPVWKEQELDKVGLSVVPKMELYKNSQWEKINNSPTLKALYDKIVSTMHEANEMQTNRLFTNDYQLPGVSAKLFDRLKQVKGIDKLTTFLKWVCEKLGINVGQDQDVLLRGETTAHDEINEENDPIYSTFTRTIGRRADGREYSALPQYFTRRLDNPEFTSGALLDIVLSYYKMSVNYHEKSKVKDQCDAILDYVKNKEYFPGMSQRTVDGVKKYLNTKGADSTEMSNVYKLLENLINFGLYGKVKIQFKTKWFDFNKIIDTTRQLTTATNLGMNKKVAAVGFMTAMHAHIVNSLVGKEYNFLSIVESGIEVVKHLIYKEFHRGAYSRRSNDVMQIMMEEFGIAQQLERKMTDLDFPDNRIGEIRRMIKQNYVFGYLATTDYLTKSQIALSVLKNYKYIDGKIYSSVDIEYMRHDKDKYSKLLSKYKKEKSLYHYMKAKDGRIYFKDAGMNKAWKDNYGRIKAKCVKLSERADGVATGLQRAAILNSWIGMIIMIHRQFLPLMLQERYGDRVYDYDMQEYKNGQFRVLFKYLSELMMNNFLVGAPTAMIALSFWISNPSWIIAIGSLLAGGAKIYGMTHNKHESIKHIHKKMFNTFEDEKSTIASMENRWAIKLIIIERVMITLMSTFVVSPICRWADDDKDDLFLQWIAYWLKGSQWEINGPYNIEELVANIKSPTAMTSLLDRFNAVAANNNSGLLNWLSTLSLTEETDKEINNNSPYAGWTHAQKAWFKALTGPIPNEYEQDKPIGAYTKRKWIERQNFHEHAGDNKDIFEQFRNLFRLIFE